VWRRGGVAHLSKQYFFFEGECQDSPPFLEVFLHPKPKSQTKHKANQTKTRLEFAYNYGYGYGITFLCRNQVR